MAATGMQPPEQRRRMWLWAAGALLGVALLGALAHGQVVASGTRGIVRAAAVAAAEAIVVPGARIHADGTPYSMLLDRLQTALDLFLQGRAPQIVLSGAGGGERATDEVAAMRRWLLARGVPADALLDDPAGLRTIDTMRNCRRLGLRRVIVVSNPFHVARCVFLAQHCGLEVQGVEAAPMFDYSSATLGRNHGREVLARIWAFCEAWWPGG